MVSFSYISRRFEALVYLLESSASAIRRLCWDFVGARLHHLYVLFHLWKANKPLFQRHFTQLEVAEREGRLNDAGLIVVADLRQAMRWRWIGHGSPPDIDRLLWDWDAFSGGRFLQRRERLLRRRLPDFYVPNVLVKYGFDINVFFLPEEETNFNSGSNPTAGAEQHDSTAGHGQSEIVLP